jgi:DNA-binding transcriptional ArsR family regulator
MASQGREDRNVVGDYAEDPDRLLITDLLAESALSPAQLAEATGIPLARVRRQIRQMREEGLIETVIRKSKRGTLEHFYLLVGGLLREGPELAKLSPEERRRHNGNLLKIVLTEASRAMVTHPTDRGLTRLDGATVRIPIFTDEAGWEELAKLHRKFLDRILAARERIEERLEKEGQNGFKASSVILFFESETAD